MKPYFFYNLISSLSPKVGWPKINSVYTDLKSTYNQSYRFYHRWRHIEEGWKEINQIRHLLINPAEFEIAWYFHDYVYIPGSTINEQASAEMAGFVCRMLEIEETFSSKVACFITNSHDSDSMDKDYWFFHDVDYSILGQKKIRYDQYVAGIKNEYFFMPLSERIEFLESQLKKPSIFFTDFFKNKYEERARLNMQNELDSYNC